MKKMKAKGYSRGGAPTTRAQRRSTLSKAQKNLLDSVQGREGSKQSTSVIQDLSDQYGYKPGKRAGAKGGMGKGKRAKPPGMQMGGAAGMASPRNKVPAMVQRPAPPAPGTTAQRLPPSGGPKAIDTAKLGALPQSRSTRPTKATAMRGAAARRSGGSTPPGMQRGGAMKAKGMQRGGMMKAKGMKKGGKVAGTSRPSATSGFRAPSSKSSGLYGK
jgi:hypothetical protein